MPWCKRAMMPPLPVRRRRISEQSAGESDRALMAEITIEAETATANCW